MKLKIEGAEYGLQWGMGAIEIYCDRIGCDVDGLDKAIFSDKEIEKQKAITTLILAAIQNYCELHEIEFDLTYRKLQQWLSDAPQNTFNEIINDWKKTMYLGKTIGEWYFGEAPADVPKKKSASVKSSKSVTK